MDRIDSGQSGATEGSRTRRAFLAGLGSATVVAVAGCGSSSQSSGSNSGDSRGGEAVASLLSSATMYKSPSCGCCEKYASILQSIDGVSLTIEPTSDMSSVKAEYRVPNGLYSCHTIVTDTYTIEGHVPIPAIRKLASDEPAVAGIGLPGMPSGSPGMGGSKSEEFQIYAYGEGEITKFTSV